MNIACLPPGTIDLDSLEAASSRFDFIGESVSLDYNPWKEFPLKNDISFRIASMGDKLLLKFYVKEREVLAQFENDNDPVCRDSCVEFFVAPLGCEGYYNFEFNCCGTLLAQYGTGRGDRRLTDPVLLKDVKRFSSIKKRTIASEEGLREWELFTVIPASLFLYENITEFSGHTFKGNFYKCGDDHKIPHYQTWNFVGSEFPDYHRPEYFQELLFE